MKRRVTLFCAVSLMSLAFVFPAAAGTIYDNGPVNGNTDAWLINFGFVLSDTFTVSSGSSTITGLSFGAWLVPGDVATSVEVSLTQQAFGGTVYFDGIVNLTQSNCAINQLNFEVCQETGTFNGPTLPNGTYWLNLQNAVDTNGDPVYWDENSGIGCSSPGCPSQATNGSIGTLPSEAFTLTGSSGGGTTPEPGGLFLFGTGVIGAAGAVRRKSR